MAHRKARFWLTLALVGCGFAVSRVQERSVASPGSRPLLETTLRQVDGHRVRLGDLAGRSGLVLVFTGNDCPNSNKSIPRLRELAAAYESKGFAFLGVNSNASETAASVAAHRTEHAISFPVLKDPQNALADLVGADRTCTVVLCDSRGVIRYQGGIDDQFGQGTIRSAPTRRYLADALDALLAGQRVAVVATRAIGCPIERVKSTPTTPRVRPAAEAIVQALEAREAQAGLSPVGPVDYAGDVAPIIQAKCQACHRPGQDAPFSLLTYADVRARAAGIEEVVADRRMPPWHADPRFGHFANDRSLSPRERATLLAWIQQGTPAGDLAHLPPPRSFPDGWTIGTPDVVFATPEPNQVPASGVLDYVIVRVPTHFRQDMWIQAAEIRPEVRSIVHHIIVQILDPNDPQQDRGEHLATYVPGDAPTRYPAGIAKLIPAGSLLKFGIHYTPDGIARTDRSRIGLVFAAQPVAHRAFTKSVESTKFRIPAYAADHPVSSTYTAPADLHLYSFSPHMHLRGKDFRYQATYPNGRTETLLSVPAYDFGWQSTYMLAEPWAIPRGTRIDCLAHFDNSTGNPANPDPAQAVEWGEQSFQEMMIGYFDYVFDGPLSRIP